ncbi:hypothetical protein RclHR1_04730010 [Rhizophagus clarus]|uniref:Glycosyltransferase family 1 protein n=1 Tax=Rhizophagus clarus TaxID=94130 RepID=A0A2Z6SD10_9GLOM|nr:hypothetical protein RclHR1_04730010 [Rhizophagus clarus]GES92872.1 glycosyltransferase family 1 protein [Rhizophagus clarus]
MKCYFRLFLKKLFLFIIICNSIFNVVTGTVPPAHDWIPNEMILDRTEIPKNILLGVTIGGWSHLRHILTIANILTDRGYNVTLTKRGNFTQSQQYPKIKFISLGEKLDLSKDLEIKHLVNEKVDTGRFKAVFKNHYAAYESIFLKLKEVAETIKPDLFFCDTLNNEPCFDVAWLMKKPLVGISTTLLGLTHVPYRSDPIFGCKVNMENESFWERFRCEFITPFQFLWSYKSSFENFNKIRANYGLPSLKTPTERWQNSLFLIDSFFGFETPISLPPLYQEIGPVLPDYFPPLTPDVEKFLNSHKRTMFVALGSYLFLSAENNAKLLQSIIEVIENNIVDGVIWANIEKYRESFPSSITLSDGRIISTSNIFDNKNPNIFMTSFAPQFSILNHTNTKIFLSHSGSGSIYESLYAGTPILALPITYDQPGNAEKLESAGVALTLDKTNLDVNDIVNKVERILNDEQIQISTKRLKTLAMINSKRKYRAADLIEFTLYSSVLKQKNTIDESDNNVEKWLFKELITPDTRMGLIRGKYLDVYTAALAIIVSIILLSIFIIKNLIFGKLFKIKKSKDKND